MKEGAVVARKRWSELGKGAKAAILMAGAVQIALQMAALRDLSRRTPAEINGSKKGWVAASFINFAGPIAYFRRGRKK